MKKTKVGKAENTQAEGCENRILVKESTRSQIGDLGFDDVTAKMALSKFEQNVMKPEEEEICRKAVSERCKFEILVPLQKVVIEWNRDFYSYFQLTLEEFIEDFPEIQKECRKERERCKDGPARHICDILQHMLTEIKAFIMKAKELKKERVEDTESLKKKIQDLEKTHNKFTILYRRNSIKNAKKDVERAEKHPFLDDDFIKSLERIKDNFIYYYASLDQSEGFIKKHRNKIIDECNQDNLRLTYRTIKLSYKNFEEKENQFFQVIAGIQSDAAPLPKDIDKKEIAKYIQNIVNHYLCANCFNNDVVKKFTEKLDQYKDTTET